MNGPWSPDMQKLVTIGRGTFEIMVAEAEDWVPTLLIMLKDGTYHTHLMAGGSPFDVLNASGRAIASQPIEWVGFTADSYCLRHDTGDHEPTQEEIQAVVDKYAGNMQQYFEAGDPDVKESLEFMLVSHDNVENVSWAYEREGGTVNWLEANHQIGLQVGGRVADILRMIVTMSQHGGVQ